MRVQTSALASIFTEEGRTRARNFALRTGGYLMWLLIMGLIASALVTVRSWRNLRPLERVYFTQYVKANVKALLLPGSSGVYTLLIIDRAGPHTGVTDDLAYPARDEQGRAIRDGIGWIFMPAPRSGIARLRWQRCRVDDQKMMAWFEENIYQGAIWSELFAPALIACLVVALGGAAAAVAIDQRINRQYEEGKRIRGSRLIEPSEYEREVKGAGGLALTVKSIQPPRGLRLRKERTWELRTRREEEAQGLMILGDTGSGKSQIIHRYLEQITKRKDETAIVYDPACEFVQAHYDRRRGDVILNPFDVRSPFWTPAFERTTRTSTIDYEILAECFFSSGGTRSPSEEFFMESARSILARLLEFNPELGELIAVLSKSEAIDKAIEGTELEHLIPPKAANQRGGVLGTLAKVVKPLKLLSAYDECRFDFSFTQWSQNKKGWLFLTSTKESEEMLRPLYAAYLNFLMRRLMSHGNPDRTVKLVVDEVHTLNFLPALYKAMTEGRKFGLHLIQGTQNKSQYEARYGKDAPTMLSGPPYTISLRCKEPGSAEWTSQLLGREEREVKKIGATSGVSDKRDSLSYSTEIVERSVVLPEEIASLPNLAGYWKYGELVVPFRFDYRQWAKVAEGYVPRPEAERRLEAPDESEPRIEETEQAQSPAGEFTTGF